MPICAIIQVMELAPSAPHLVVCGPAVDRKVILLDGSAWKLGRGRQNSIVIDDDLVSRHHAIIQRMDSGEYFLIDMGSRNGSFVNDRRVSIPIPLHDGDRLALGDAQMVFHNPVESADPATLAPSDVLPTVSRFKECLVSVLVVDIRGFTGLSQRLENALLCQLTGSWFGEADRIMRGAGSDAQKYIGDAVMAVWTHLAPGRERLEILDILRAASEFARVTAELGPRFSLAEGLQIGAGLNTGMATVGNAGAGQVHDYTAMGECVNAAFRLESATKGLQTDLCVGKTTSDFLRGSPAAAACFEETGVALRGYEAPVRACAVRFQQLDIFLETTHNAPPKID